MIGPAPYQVLKYHLGNAVALEQVVLEVVVALVPSLADQVVELLPDGS